MLTSASGGVTLAYDPLLRLYQLAGGATTRFGYDGIDLIAETDGAGTVLRRYAPGPGIDEPIVWYEGAGTTDRRFLHADERGSIIATSDSSGNMLAINKYDDFGKPQATNVGRFQYTGQKWLSEIGLYDYKARMYAPHLPRFLQTNYSDSNRNSGAPWLTRRYPVIGTFSPSVRPAPRRRRWRGGRPAG